MNHLHVVVHLHLHAVIVDDKLIHVGNNLLHPVHIQEQTVCGHEDKGIRQFFPCIFVKLHNARVKPRLVVAVQGQMPLIVPVVELVNHGIIERVIHLLVGTLFRVNVGGTELTCTVAAVHSLQIHHERMRRLLMAHKIRNILFL